MVYTFMFLTIALLLLFIGWFIYRGKTIHLFERHQISLKDHSAFGKVVGRSMIILSLFCVLSGILELYFDNWVPIIILVIGLIYFFYVIERLQKRYN